MMNAPAHFGGGFQPSPNTNNAFQSSALYPVASHNFTNTLAAVEAMPAKLNRITWALHNVYGTPHEIILGNLFGVLSFVGQGLANVRDIKAELLSLSIIMHVIGKSTSGKSGPLKRLMKAVDMAMVDWPDQWEFDDATPEGIKRVAPPLAFNYHHDGDTFLNSRLGKDFDFQIALRDGILKAMTRAKKKDGERKHKATTRFTTLVNDQLELYLDWLAKHRKKALASGFLQRAWIVHSIFELDKSAIGQYPQSDGALDEWDARVPLLLNQAKANSKAGLESLPTLDLSFEAQHILRQEQARYDGLAQGFGPLSHVPALAIRHHEWMCVLAGLFHCFEGEGDAISGDTMWRAAIVADFLTGQWLSVVFPPLPPPPMSEVQQDAMAIRPCLHDEFSRGAMVWEVIDKDGVVTRGIKESEVVKSAKNLGLSAKRTKEALLYLYSTKEFQFVVRTINGKATDLIERQYSPFLLR